MFIPVHISSLQGLDLMFNIPTGFDYEINWNKNQQAVIYLDDKKITLPRDEDDSIIHIAYQKCSKYFLSNSGIELKIKTYDISYPDHIAAAIIIKETARKFNYPDEWAISVFEKIFHHQYDQASSYIYAILSENEGEYFYNEIENSLQYAHMLNDQGKLTLRYNGRFNIQSRNISKEQMLQVLSRHNHINWITLLHDMHILTDHPGLNAFLEDVRSNELTTLALPVTDGWNYFIIAYFYRHKSKRMQEVMEELYKKHLGQSAVFVG